MMRYWLFKSEPSVFSIFHLEAAPDQTSMWEGVRNYQARNYLRDEVRMGDLVFFYHSRESPLGIFGTMVVVREAYPDPTQFDPDSGYYDPLSTADVPRWVAVDVKLVQIFPSPVTRTMLSQHPVTSQMLVLKKGMRLSIQPVTKAEWAVVHELARVIPK